MGTAEFPMPVELAAQNAAAVVVAAHQKLRISQLRSGSGRSPEDHQAASDRKAPRILQETQETRASQ